MAFVVAAYLLGSVSFAVVTSRLFGLPDPHSYGSGNPGATNVLRTGNKAAAILTLAGDGAKGWLAVFLAQDARAFVRRRRLDGSCRRARRVRRAPVPGVPRFAGGKGVATAAGIVFALHWPLGLALGALWLVMAVGIQDQLARRRSRPRRSLPPGAFYVFGNSPPRGRASPISLLLFWRHRTNIRQLLEGRETHDRPLARDQRALQFRRAGSDARSQRGRTENA